MPPGPPAQRVYLIREDFDVVALGEASRARHSGVLANIGTGGLMQHHVADWPAAWGVDHETTRMCSEPAHVALVILVEDDGVSGKHRTFERWLIANSIWPARVHPTGYLWRRGTGSSRRKHQRFNATV